METLPQHFTPGNVVFRSGLVCLRFSPVSGMNSAVIVHADKHTGTWSLPTAFCTWLQKAEGSPQHSFESFDMTATRIAETQTGYFSYLDGYHPHASPQPGNINNDGDFHFKSPFLVEMITNAEGITTITSWFLGRFLPKEPVPVDFGAEYRRLDAVTMFTKEAIEMLGDQQAEVLKKGLDAWNSHIGYVQEEARQLGDSVTRAATRDIGTSTSPGPSRRSRRPTTTPTVTREGIRKARQAKTPKGKK